ncbi:hypothetical protein [Thalassotalea atypica]|uniref:hypothetical protein n=1 Tax=Thalassotalea atypica TaxID=2054316 RepID=UPI0025729B31|nr:hypothetical protein [Thalassotalea atypica]
MNLAGIRAQIDYKKRKGSYGHKPSVVADNQMKWQFDVGWQILRMSTFIKAFCT